MRLFLKNLLFAACELTEQKVSRRIPELLTSLHALARSLQKENESEVKNPEKRKYLENKCKEIAEELGIAIEFSDNAKIFPLIITIKTEKAGNIRIPIG